MKTCIFILLLCGISAARAQDSISVSAKTYVAELEKTIAGRENEPSENVFKNIQSLKGIPAGRLLKIMQLGFSKSLGVDCSHCHNPKAWDSDEKDKKEIARKMWKFTGEIKKELSSITNKKAVVNCNTCHRGATEPAF
ncbi:c-type cytochrome [bacterium]|nr:c-type cytochrome [bacterium]